MGRLYMEKRRNFSSNASMWCTERKETLGRPLLRWEDQVKKDGEMMEPDID